MRKKLLVTLVIALVVSAFCACEFTYIDVSHNHDVPHEHSWSTEWTIDAEKHWHECECGEKDSEAVHAGGTATCTAKAVCETCGSEYGELLEHAFEAKKDATHHWTECACGEATERVEHAFEAKKDATHHWTECACGEATEKVAHVFEAKKDATHHWTECACGEATEKIAHSFEAKKDATHHWTECACGEATEKVEHSFEAKEDATHHWTECACGEATEKIAHVFEVKKDATHHWTECACGEATEKVEHAFEAKKDATHHWTECACGEATEKIAHVFEAKETETHHWTECACGEATEEIAYVFELSVEKTSYSFEWVVDGDKVLNRKGEEIAIQDLAQNLGVVATRDGVACLDKVTYATSKASVAIVENGSLVPVGDGSAKITVALSDKSIEVNVVIDVYTAINTQAQMEAIAISTYAKYMLMADIDVKGGYFKSIGGSNYANNDGIGFKGIFDGNGHAVMNYIPSNNGSVANNTGLFAVLRNNSIIRNLNCINAVVKSRSAALVAHCYGRIENCFVDATIDYFENSANNPTAAVTTKLNAQGSIYNTIVVIRLSETKDFTKAHTIGAVVGRSYAGAIIQDCYSISPAEIKFYAENASSFDAATETNYGDFDSLAAFYSEVSAFAGWNFENGFYPTYGKVSVTLSAESATVSKNSTYQVEATSNLPVVYALAENYAGVTLSESGLVTLTNDVAVEEILVNVKSLYNSAVSAVARLEVAADSYEFTMGKTAYDLKWLTTDTTDPSEELSYTLLKNGTESDEELTFTSTNASVAKVVDGKLIGVADGSATITILLGDLELGKITVKCAEYIPVYTVADFNNVDNNKAAKYMLMNDIDFADENGNATKFASFSSYRSVITNKTTVAFTGIFDGNGYALRNIIPWLDRHSTKDWDYSIFGVIGNTGVIRNLAIYAETHFRGGVISNWMMGTIENCYVEALIVDSSKAVACVEHNKNGLGLMAQCPKSGSRIVNCVAKLVFAEGNTDYSYVSGIAAENQGSIVDCSVIFDNAAHNLTAEPQLIGVFNPTTSGVTGNSNGTCTGSAVYASEAKLASEGTVSYNANIWSITQSAVTLVNGCTINRPAQG